MFRKRLLFFKQLFCNRMRGYISCPQFSFRSLQYFTSTLHFSPLVQFPCTSSLQSVLVFVSVTFSLLILVLFLFNQLFSSCSVKSSCVSCLCLKCLIVSTSSLILVITTVCYYYVIILLVISISQIHRLVGKTPLLLSLFIIFNSCSFVKLIHPRRWIFTLLKNKSH
jgi:hypothetical protein